MRTGTGPAPRVAHSIALLAGDTGGQSADNPDFTDLYYPLCVSGRIDTWQIVYLSYKEPCPTISTHKRYTFMSHECTCDQYPFNGQMDTGTGPALVYFNDTSSKYSDHNLTIRPSISAINRSSECVIYATLDQRWLPGFPRDCVCRQLLRHVHSQALPRRSGTTPPGNCTWQSLSSTGGGGGS